MLHQRDFRRMLAVTLALLRAQGKVSRGVPGVAARKGRRALAWAVSLACGALAACAKDATEPSVPETTAACAAQASIDLQPGTGQLLPAGDSLCFAVGAAGLYAVAYLDAGYIDAARPDLHYDVPFGDSFSVAAAFRPPVPVTGPAAAPGATSPRPAAGGGLPADVVTVSAADTCGSPPWCRETPWKVGDEVTTWFAEGRKATVVAIAAPLVLAEWNDEMPLEGEDGVIVDVVKEAAQSVVPMLSAAFDGEVVSTSPGSGQLMVLVQRGSLSFTYSQWYEGGSSSFILLSLNPDVADAIVAADDIQILAHELAHAWQVRYLYKGAGPNSGARHWGLEGGADFFTLQYLRSRFGIPLDANGEAIGENILRAPEDVYWTLVNRSSGEIEAGYYQTEPLLRDLMVRLVRAGMSERDALSNISKGAVEGWFGRVNASWHPPGIAARMSMGLGQQWDPVTGVLTWVLSDALDDRSTGDTFTNPSVLNAWKEVGQSGFSPSGRLGVGRATTTRRAGSTGYFELLARDEPDRRLILTSESAGTLAPIPGIGETEVDVRWMVARIH